ncbi:MAG: SMP-30/gluconolactonase/LRE family protein [Acidimicrobiales bacterium]|nr:SMP-30/gluconolactonase/LRE family protein [Hyphomonadaceae bacterium]RZV41189.1 MAG: SMP-30/gluconolactonase/LRE family protein [Acidimicrobiales bacterium]
MARVKCIWEAQATLGEGPIWVAHEQTLYWVDIKAPSIHCYQPNTQGKKSWPLDEKIGCLVYRPNDGFLAGLESGFARVEFGDSGTEPIINKIVDPEPDLPGNRFNDGKLDTQGRFWAGTMDNAETKKSGSWWVLDHDDQVYQIDTGYQVTNGPAFDEARNRVYLTDSAAQTIYCAEKKSGIGIANKRVFCQFGEGDGYPDGMTTDADGNLWVAFWDGSCIRQFDLDGNIIRTVNLPIPRPTSLCFDTNRSALFVTSARINLCDQQIFDAPLSGGLFEVIV